MFYSDEGAGEPVAKKVKVDDSLDGGMKDLAKAKVTEVSSGLASARSVSSRAKDNAN